MDDFRVGSIPPSDPITRHPADDAAGRRRKKHSGPPPAEEDVVSLSEHEPEDEEPGIGYGPRRENE
jgi:hypothetical protein